MNRIITALAGTLMLGSAADAATHTALKGGRYASQAKVSLATARASAIKARPGKMTDQELEKEKGGSGLRYSFDIASGRQTYEVGIDAATGAVLENAAEGAHPD